MPKTNYPMDPTGWSQLVKPKPSAWSPAPGISAFESMIPGQSAVSGDLSTALINALKGQFPEEYFTTAIAGPLRRTFEQETRPAIAEEFVGPGTYWGTARAGEVTKGRTRMEEDITAKRAELAYQTQQQALQAALAYLGIPLMAAYQPYEGGGTSLQGALAKPKPPHTTYQLGVSPGAAIPGGPTYASAFGGGPVGSAFNLPSPSAFTRR